MMFFSWLKGRNRRLAGATGLYQSALSASRQPDFYNVLQVPDTLDGRFDLVALHVFLLIDRLAADKTMAARAMIQPVFDIMFRMIDTDLREQGLDMSVGKYIRRMMRAFNGRLRAYETAMRQGDLAMMEEALARNVWRAEDTSNVSGASELAAYAFAARDALATQDVELLCTGNVVFPTLTEIIAPHNKVAAHV